MIEEDCKKQAFEEHHSLASHIERMAVSGNIGNGYEWQRFTSDLNECINGLENKIYLMEEALMKIYDSPSDTDGIIDISYDALTYHAESFKGRAL